MKLINKQKLNWLLTKRGEEMSYDLGYNCTLDEKHQISGGTYAMGGTTDPWLNITYNYSKWFVKYLGEGGIRSLYGKQAKEVAEILIKTIPKMKTDVDRDYWAATEGNARKALSDLLSLTLLVPQDAVLDGD